MAAHRPASRPPPGTAVAAGVLVRACNASLGSAVVTLAVLRSAPDAADAHAAVLFRLSDGVAGGLAEGSAARELPELRIAGCGCQDLVAPSHTAPLKVAPTSVMRRARPDLRRHGTMAMITGPHADCCSR
mmetsp:Transcript_112913/g.343610  ORF Transcript_112913/g.343610 Transcript_112913/m.343610 type:complete len:130 (+) Transcript_112913:47-436(+)